MSQIFGDVADVALAMQAMLRCVAKPEVFMCLMGGTRRVLAVRGVPKTINICIISHRFASFEKDLLCLAQCLAQCLAAFGCAFSLHPCTGDPESALAFIQGLYPHTHATGRPCFKQNHISIVIFKIYLRMYFRNLPDVIEDAWLRVCAVEVSLGFMCSCCSLNFESRISSIRKRCSGKFSKDWLWNSLNHLESGSHGLGSRHERCEQRRRVGGALASFRINILADTGPWAFADTPGDNRRIRTDRKHPQTLYY